MRLSTKSFLATMFVSVLNILSTNSIARADTVCACSVTSVNPTVIYFPLPTGAHDCNQLGLTTVWFIPSGSGAAHSYSTDICESSNHKLSGSSPCWLNMKTGVVVCP